MPRCYLAFGGNSGDVAQTFTDCLDELARTPGVTRGRVSKFHRTEPVGTEAGDAFLNAASEIVTDLPPLALLDLLQRLELKHGRTREKHWGPRTLDLDLIFYGDEIIEEPRLTVPHPACWYRRFVLDPLAEIAAEVTHPVKEITVDELRERLLVRPLRIELCGGTAMERQELIAALSGEFPDIRFEQFSVETGPPTILAWLGAGDDESAWERLPIVPRLDLTKRHGAPLGALRDVVHSATGE